MAIVTHMDTNAEEKMINLHKKRELLLDKAEKYTQSMIHEKDDWYDSLLDDLIIDYAIRQNAKISESTYGVIVLENYIEDNIINPLAKRIFNDLKIDNTVNDSYECIFDLELMGVIKDTLESIFDAKMIKKGFIKKNIRLSSNYYFLLPPNCMDEYVHIWVSESLNKEEKPINNLFIIALIMGVLSVIGHFLMTNTGIIGTIAVLMFAIGLSCFIAIGLFLFKEYPFAIKKQLLELLVIEKSERDKRNNDK
ncbi:hypothetical protein [Lactobacillus johnsonii]|uniref:Uncharacterized protein n=1 Tax=Lactobacillus johnsonii TaxID=33959 RepID=A0A9X0J7N1_LACJH|nr:hypothetical protein [Lactobacillus johnsonii]KXN76496.1 hypothetical protein AYJ53_03010 [Lactobacillus johnsonii]